jgi:hypothetical protein
MPFKITNDVVKFPKAQFLAVRGPDINFRGLGFEIMQQEAAYEAGAPYKQATYFR